MWRRRTWSASNEQVQNLILYINSLGLPIRDVTFCCIIIFYVSAAEPAIGKSIFVWNWHPRETCLISTQLSIRPCFFFYLFFGFVFSEKSKATYLLLFLSFFWGLKNKK